MKEQLPSVENALSDHALWNFSPGEFMDQQKRAGELFRPHIAHHAGIELEAQSEGMLLVKKTYGKTARTIPFRIAGELCDDYIENAKRHKELGIQTAENYGITVMNDDGIGVITVHQLLFPQGTLLDWLRNPDLPPDLIGETLRQTARQTLIPILRHNLVHAGEAESPVFSDGAPKNIAPIQDPEGKIHAFYFDFFVPRIRNAEGKIKEYPGFNPHTRDEDEMRERFFTKPGIINNFLLKARRDLIDTDFVWDIVKDVMSEELRPWLDQYFPGLSLDTLAQTKYRAGVDEKIAVTIQ